MLSDTAHAYRHAARSLQAYGGTHGERFDLRFATDCAWTSGSSGQLRAIDFAGRSGVSRLRARRAAERDTRERVRPQSDDRVAAARLATRKAATCSESDRCIGRDVSADRCRQREHRPDGMASRHAHRSTPARIIATARDASKRCRTAAAKPTPPVTSIQRSAHGATPPSRSHSDQPAFKRRTIRSGRRR